MNYYSFFLNGFILSTKQGFYTSQIVLANDEEEALFIAYQNVHDRIKYKYNLLVNYIIALESRITTHIEQNIGIAFYNLDKKDYKFLYEKGIIINN